MKGRGAQRESHRLKETVVAIMLMRELEDRKKIDLVERIQSPQPSAQQAVVSGWKMMISRMPFDELGIARPELGSASVNGQA